MSGSQRANKQHHSKVLLNSFPMNGHTLGFCTWNQKLENFVSHKVSFWESKGKKMTGDQQAAADLSNLKYFNYFYERFNPLRPKSDLSPASHCNIKGLSVSEIMRIENTITQGIFY